LKLREHGLRISDQTLRRTLQNIKLVGRFEFVREKPVVILDGAHNPMKVDAFVDTLTHLQKHKKVAIIFAAKKGKDVRKELEALEPIAKKFYFTKFEATTDFGKRMAYDPQELATNTKQLDNEVFDDARSAYLAALMDSENEDTICVTGSLYLVGELRSFLLS
jgi:dihydrofolate synthase/folylpolyglutamate synthase